MRTGKGLLLDQLDKLFGPDLTDRTPNPHVVLNDTAKGLEGL
jgi:hypothetical protein